MAHGLELLILTCAEAFQPLGQVIQLVHIDLRACHTLQHGILAVHLNNTAVLPQGISDAEILQQFHGVIVLFTRDREGNSNAAILRVQRRIQNRRHHLSALPMFVTSGPYRAMRAAQRTNSRVSSLTSSGSASSSEVAPSVPEQRPFATR